MKICCLESFVSDSVITDYDDKRLHLVCVVHCCRTLVASHDFDIRKRYIAVGNMDTVPARIVLMGTSKISLHERLV